MVILWGEELQGRAVTRVKKVCAETLAQVVDSPSLGTFTVGLDGALEQPGLVYKRVWILLQGDWSR